MRFKKGDRVRIKKFKKRPSNWNSSGKMAHKMVQVATITNVADPFCYYIYDAKEDYEWSFREDQVEPANETIVIYAKGNEVIALDKSTGKKGIARCCPDDTFDFETGARIAFERLLINNKFGAEVREVKRAANVGEYIKIVNASGYVCDEYENGDILKVVDRRGAVPSHDGRAYYKDAFGKYAERDEYVVLEGYHPEEPTYYDGKIIFTKGDEIFETGHIYEIKDGHIQSPCTGSMLPIGSLPFETIDDVKEYFSGKPGFNWSNEPLELIEVLDD